MLLSDFGIALVLFEQRHIKLSRSAEVMKKFASDGLYLSNINFGRLSERTYNFRDSLSMTTSCGKTNVVLSCATSSVKAQN